MKLHIINLEERKDRNYQMKQQVRKFNFDHIFIEAIRGNGSYGPGMSHCKCIEYAIKNNLDSILVCEDDVILKKDTMEKLNNLLKSLPYDWDIFLGGASGLYDCSKTNEFIFKVGNFSGLHFVVYHKRVYQKILNWLNSKKKRRFRKFSTHPHIDRYLGKLSINNQIKVYAPFEFLVDTYDSYSDVRKIHTSDSGMFDKVKDYVISII